MNISVFGAGTWGMSLAVLLKKNGHSVKVWTHSKENLDELINMKKLKHLPDLNIEGIEISIDEKSLVENQDIIILAVASPYIREVSHKIKKYLTDNQIIVIVSKGLEKNTNFTMSEIVEDEIKNDKIKIVALSGPTHAEEVSKDLPSAIVSACEDTNTAKIIQDVFMNENFRVYTNDDIKGVEIAAAFKNIYALASGMAYGYGFGDNTRAIIITRGLAEMVRLGLSLNCRKETFYGLAGIGDLIVTATSIHSRNFRCGRLIGEGKTVDEAIKEVDMVVEGINCIPAAIEMKNKYNIDMPIVDGMNEIVFNNKKAIDVFNKLMNREKKSETL